MQALAPCKVEHTKLEQFSFKMCLKSIFIALGQSCYPDKRIFLVTLFRVGFLSVAFPDFESWLVIRSQLVPSI